MVRVGRNSSVQRAATQGLKTVPLAGRPPRKNAQGPKPDPHAVRAAQAKAHTEAMQRITSIRARAGPLNPVQKGLFERYLGDLLSATTPAQVNLITSRLPKLNIPEQARRILDEITSSHRTIISQK